MLRSDTNPRREPHYGATPRRLIRRGRIALLFALFAFWLTTVAQAFCLVPLAPVGAGGTNEHIGMPERGPAQQPADSPDDNAHCPDSLIPDAAPEQAVTAPAADVKLVVPLAPAAAGLAIGIDVSVAQLHPPTLFPPDRPLYLRTSRLLI